MSLHKLTAGDGYTYLTRQVAAHDATERGHSGLSDYYSERGESPGRWWGAGLEALSLESGSEVTEPQMRALFGEGRHPGSVELMAKALAAGSSVSEVERSTRLGRTFRVYARSASPFQQLLAQRFGAFNKERGRRETEAVPAEERAVMRTRTALECFREEHGRAPLDERELAGFIAAASRPLTKAIAGFDLSFTPVKSVSALWALGEPELAAQVEQAHHSAVARTLRFLEEEVLFTRRGRDGVQQVATRGMVAACFFHRDSRTGDPNLHTHVALSNKVQTADGAWLAVDGRVLYKANVTLSEMYNSLVEAEVRQRLRVRFVAADSLEDEGFSAGSGRRDIRELAGIDPRIVEAWSSRSRAIETRRRVLVSDFQALHGRPPTPAEAITLAQQANLETREAKHAPRSEREQRQAWHAQAVEVLGSEDSVRAMVSRVLKGGGPARRVSRRWVDSSARHVIARIESERACWQLWHVEAEAWRRVRADDVAPRLMERAVRRVVSRALRLCEEVVADPDPLAAATATPPPLLRADGVPVYLLHRGRMYTSRRVLGAEASLMAAAQTSGGRTAAPAVVEATLQRAGAAGAPLSAAQSAFVRELACSPRLLQVAIAPAGTGKTTAVAVFGEAWRRSGGDVIGLAPSAAAAEQLRDALASHATPAWERPVVCETLSKYVWSLESGNLPPWLSAVGPRTLVVVDEAGMASTVELAAMTRDVTTRGGSVRLVGDDRQLGAVGAGGVLRDIAQQTGSVTLTEVRRFSDAAEAAATLALRDGDPAAIGFYADRGRIHVGDLSTAAEQAFEAWSSDVRAGATSLLIAPTRDLVRELNQRAQLELMTGRQRLLNESCTEARGDRSTTGVSLHDGTRTYPGDRIVTRRNNRQLRMTPTDWVKNGDRWEVLTVDPDTALQVRHLRTGSRVILPGSYVAEHVELGYATTIHGAQGMTVDTAHAVLTGQEDRALLYVAVTRGRTENHLYLVTTTDGDQHSVIRPEVVHPATAVDILTSILASDDAEPSATTTRHERLDPGRRLREAALRYHDSLTFAAEYKLGPEQLRRIAHAAATAVPGLHDEPAWPTLRAHLALWQLDGHDALDLLNVAAAAGLSETRDAAAVLDHRIASAVHAPIDADVDKRGGHTRSATRTAAPQRPQAEGPLPWLPAVPAALRDDPGWGVYLASRDAQVRLLATDVARLTQSWTIGTAPAWARPFLGHEADRIRADLAIWRAVHDTHPRDLRPTGTPERGAPGDHQRHLRRAASTISPTYPYRQRSWFALLPEGVRDDPWAAVLGRRLSQLERAGLPVALHLREALRHPEAQSGEGPLAPLPDLFPAAALWWRLVPRLGPAVVAADGHDDYLTPTWATDLATILGHGPAEDARTTPAWPALVASVDEACHHGWTPMAILTAARPDRLEPRHIDETVEDLVLRIASLTSPPLRYQVLERRESTLGVTPSEQRLKLPNASDDPVHLHLDDRVTPERLYKLNKMAFDFFQQCYPRSWAPAYLADRMGDAPLPVTSAAAGYAPPGQRSLVRHLAARGATADEILAAGLARLRHRASRDAAHPAAETMPLNAVRVETLIDAFRDRLILPVRTANDLDPQHSHIAGFVGRRNPHRPDDRFVGPKYLNTQATGVFHKSGLLYGLAEAMPAIKAGAVPVLVEGPLDALALSLAGGADVVGLAPLGTAISPAHVSAIRRLLIGRHGDLVVATDADSAGWRAAQTAYWLLTASDLDPRIAKLPTGEDPASVLQDHGPACLAQLISTSVPLAEAMIETEISRCRDVTDIFARDRLLASVSEVIAARPPSTWPSTCESFGGRLQEAPVLLLQRVLSTSIERDRDVSAWSHARAVVSRRQRDLARPHGFAQADVSSHLTTPLERTPGTDRRRASRPLELL